MEKNDINTFGNDFGFDYKAYAEILSNTPDDALINEFIATQAIINSDVMNCALIDIALNLDNILRDEVFKRYNAMVHEKE